MQGWNRLVAWLRGTYRRRRDRFLATDPGRFGLAAGEATIPFGAMVEFGCPNGVIMVAERADGSAMRLSCGRTGIINGGSNQIPFRSQGMLAQSAGDALSLFSTRGQLPPPMDGVVVFHVLTNNGIFSTQAEWLRLLAGGHPLEPLYQAGWALLKELEANSSEIY